MLSVRISSLKLKDIGGIRTLDLPLNPGLNLLCGTNGVGKTTILESIATAFSPNYPNGFIRRRAAAKDPGQVVVNIISGGVQKGLSGTVIASNPNEPAQSFGSRDEAVSVIVLRATRDFSYTRTDAISGDPDVNVNNVQQRISGAASADEIKRWFANRYLMRPHGKQWPKYRLKNLDTAKKMFSYLDPSVSLSHVDTSTFDVFVVTSNGKLVFEYLSSGFRSAYYLLLGIIKEIEFRQLEVAAEDFSGVILIDELDLHLHPTWQRTISNALKSTFPRAQIIATTHSPHAIQAAAATEVIALVRDVKGETRVQKLPSSEFGFSGWTIEEILRDVMGMEDTQTQEYRAAVEAFDVALDSENELATAEALRRLNTMLHPSSPLRKIFDIQAAAVTGPDH